MMPGTKSRNSENEDLRLVPPMQNLWWAQNPMGTYRFLSPVSSARPSGGATDRPHQHVTFFPGASSGHDSVCSGAPALPDISPRNGLQELGRWNNSFEERDPQLKSHDPRRGRGHQPTRKETISQPTPPPGIAGNLPSLERPYSVPHARIPAPFVAGARGRPEDVLADDPAERDRRNALHVDDAAAQVQDLGPREGRARGRDARAARAAAEGGAPGREERAAVDGRQGAGDGEEAV